MGNETVTVGNGQELLVTHVGHGELKTSTQTLGLIIYLGFLILLLISCLFISYAFKIMFSVILMLTSS